MLGGREGDSRIADPPQNRSIPRSARKVGRGEGGMCVLPKLGDVAGDDDDDEKCFGAILTHFGK